MDLSIFDQVFALRDEARNADLAADAPDLSSLGRGTNIGKIVTPPSPPNEKPAADLMARAVALHEQATRSEGKNDRASRSAIAELLKSASARLPTFDESDLATERIAMIDKTEESTIASEPETGVEKARPTPVKKAAPQKKGGTRKRK